ncbi:SDR family NAD(P)-dependent oxidoreductase [Mycobacterium stomatepiae]|uniref:SDR family NAD(P)-dependent oxidoreductase n=1 Tax=Mycobacterium stomatepiae TaxID=470076 RepID=UPI0013D3F205|nr:SDR family NAD(P)-dependent oxidoreductase [Mycobacterium stomatepiae]MCV7167740.1 SDR family NAD(P)-dependent oxidoreductase [Mycobacterium stomatepiae]
MSKRTIVITGASDGVGAAAARRLAAAGNNVVVVGRSESKTKAVAEELEAEYICADFADLAQVRRLAYELRRRYPRIDVLANNAGSVYAADGLTIDGFDSVLQVNYLAAFLLTTLLMDVLVASKARIICTSSSSQRLVCPGASVDDLLCVNPVRPTVAYGRSKIALVMFARELHRRYGGLGVSAASFHPGFVNSNFGPASGSRVLKLMERAHTERLVGITPEAACDQLVWLACEAGKAFEPEGEYFVKRRVGRAHRISYHQERVCELWDRTSALVNREPKGVT